MTGVRLSIGLTVVAIAFLPEASRAQARLAATPLSPALSGGSVFAKAYPLSGTALFVGYPGSFVSAATFDRFDYRALETPGTLGFGAAPSSAQFGVAGLLNESGGDGLPDLAYLDTSAQRPDFFFGSNPGTLRQPNFQLGTATGTQPLSLIHMLATRGDVLVYSTPTSMLAFDLDNSGGIASQQGWSEAGDAVPDDLPLPVRLSPSARVGTGGVDVVRGRVFNGWYSVDLLWLLDSRATSLTPCPYEPVNVALPRTAQGPNTPRGAGALDVDGDGTPDLVSCLWDGAPGVAGRLVWMKNGNTTASLTNATAYDLTAQLGIADPRLLRPVELDGVPAIAIWDAGGAGSIVVVTSEGSPPQLRIWRAPARGDRVVFDMVAGDVVGSALDDLVVVYVDPQQAAPASIDVFPDSGDGFPTVSFKPAPPTCALQGAALPLEVNAADDRAVAKVKWYVDGKETATVAKPPYGVALPGSSAASVKVTARAVDDGGLWSETSATIPLRGGAPSLQLIGDAARSIRLQPGGYQAPLSAQATDPCGAPLPIQWQLVQIAPGATATFQTDQLFIPESSYPALLASSALYLVADAKASVPTGTSAASVRFDIDPTGLLQIEQSSDRAQLAPGEIALVTTTIRSRLKGTALPQIRIEALLDGLQSAGPMVVEGGEIQASQSNGDSSSVTLVQLAPGGVPVTLRLPVRRTLSSMGQLKTQVVAAGGAILSPANVLETNRATQPGIGCGQGESGPWAWVPLALAGLLWARGRSRRWRQPPTVR